MSDEQVKATHPRDRVRAKLDAYIDRLEGIFFNSESEIAAIKAGEALLKIAEVSAMEKPVEEPIKIKRAAPPNITPISEAS